MCWRKQNRDIGIRNCNINTKPAETWNTNGTEGMGPTKQKELPFKENRIFQKKVFTY